MAGDILEPSAVKEVILGENDPTTTPTKKVSLYGWDSDGLAKVRLKVDANGNLVVKQAASTIGDGNVTTTAGTAKKLIASATPCKRVVVHAVGGHIVVGGSTCVYAVGTRRGTLIHKTQKETFYPDDVSKLYVDSAANVLVAFYYEN